MTARDDILGLLERISRVVQNDGHAEGLKPAQWEALRFVARANRFSRTPRALTEWLGVTKGTVSQTLNALERKGLVEKASAADDRRHVLILLTAKGVKALSHDPLNDMIASLSKLSAPQRRALSDGLGSLVRATLRARGGRSFGACKTCRHFRKNVDGGAPHLCGLLDEPLSAADSERICVEHEAAA